MSALVALATKGCRTFYQLHLPFLKMSKQVICLTAEEALNVLSMIPGAKQRASEICATLVKETQRLVPQVDEMPFGKYQGMKLTEVNDQDPRYIKWIKGKLEEDPEKFKDLRAALKAFN